MSKISENQSDEVSHEQPPLPKIPDSQSGRVLHLLLWLSHYLKYQIDMAKQSLMKAACNKPGIFGNGGCSCDTSSDWFSDIFDIDRSLPINDLDFSITEKNSPCISKTLNK
jgi:hypothetical protein